MIKMKGRKPLSVGMKQSKEQFDKELRTYSTKALKNIISIAENSFHANTRLRANEYLLDKTFGRDYRAVVPEKDNTDVKHNITLKIIDSENNIDFEEVNKVLKEEELWEADV